MAFSDPADIIRIEEGVSELRDRLRRMNIDVTGDNSNYAGTLAVNLHSLARQAILLANSIEEQYKKLK